MLACYGNRYTDSTTADYDMMLWSTKGGMLNRAGRESSNNRASQASPVLPVRPKMMVVMPIHIFTCRWRMLLMMTMSDVRW